MTLRLRRLINNNDRQQDMKLILEACDAGDRKQKAYNVLGLSMHTVERWQRDNGLQDKRKQVLRIPKNKLSREQRDMIIATANHEFYRDLPPCKIVPLLADAGVYR